MQHRGVDYNFTRLNGGETENRRKSLIYATQQFKIGDAFANWLNAVFFFFTQFPMFTILTRINIGKLASMNYTPTGRRSVAFLRR